VSRPCKTKTQGEDKFSRNRLISSQSPTWGPADPPPPHTLTKKNNLNGHQCSLTLHWGKPENFRQSFAIDGSWHSRDELEDEVIADNLRRHVHFTPPLVK